MSDDEDHSSLEDDFSASEDEWKPGKSNRQASEDESDDDDSDFEDDAPGSKKRDSKSRLSATSKTEGGAKQTKKRKSTGTSLRTKLFNKYKPPPKTVRNQATPSKPLVEPVKSAKKPQKKGLQVDSSDSDSSGDDYLVNPEELDLQSSFFDVKPSTSGEAAPPQFDCNAGMKLTDSEGDGDDDDDETESIRVAPNEASSKNSTKPVDLGYLQDFASNMEKAKVQYKKHKDRSLLASSDAKVDVSSLLAMGEGATSSAVASNAKKTKNPKRQSKKQQSSQVAAADTDSDWEEVEGRNESEPVTQLPDTLSNGIQVCVDLPQRQRKDKKAIDHEATLKRQLNRIIKENQIYLHKVSLLGHIYYGLYLNKLANNINLMPIVLKLLPSKNVYPTGQTEIKYFQSMVTWYKTAVKIVDDRMHPKLKVDPLISLAVQMKHRHAVCKRDFLLMFVILLRAMGMQCRLVVNMAPLPLKPDQSSLCSLKTKPADENGKPAKAVKKETSAKKVKPPAKKEPIKSPLLSNDSRIELKRKVETLEKELNNKKRGKLQPKPSFEEVLEAKAPSLKTSKKSASKPKDISSKKEGLKSKSQEKPKDTRSNKEDLKRKSQEKTSESGKKKKPDPVSTKSPYFSDSEKSNSQKLEQEKLKASLESHSKSFDEQTPSISVRTKRSTAKTAAKQPKAAATCSTFSQTKTTSKTAKQKVSNKVAPQVVITTDVKQNSENIASSQSSTKSTESRSKSPKTFISADFLQTNASKALQASANQASATRSRSKSPNSSESAKTFISSEFLKKPATKSEKSSPRKLRSKVKLTVPQLDGANDMPKRREKKTAKSIQTDSEDDFQPSPPKRPKVVVKLRGEKIDRQVLSPDVADEDPSPSKVKKNAVNMWVEVYCELEDKWVCVDLFKGKVNCIDTIRKSVTPSTLAYVFAFNNDATIKDITPRYCSQWTAVVRKGRVEQAWLDEALREYVTTHRTQRDLTEDMDLRRIHLDKPMPTAISEYKDNPLYALERHLLKFQAIYPPNALTLGFVRGEPVYARECVHTLHSREIWLKSARVVKLGEKPYKIVKARPKWDKMTSTVIKDQPLEIFGYWQTQEYEPPTAENGIVPRNAYGNVELFKECMLPKKTVHLHLPGLNRVCKKLGIDCVPAVIGFDFHQGSCHPLYDGFVVCEEFAEIAADAWEKDQQEAERKEQEKYEARVYGNWKKLIKAVLIRERLKLKYNF